MLKIGLGSLIVEHYDSVLLNSSDLSEIVR